MEFDGEPTKVGFWKTEGKARLDLGDSRPVTTSIARMVFGMANVVLEANLPSVFDHIDTEWDATERKLVERYVADQKFRGEGYMGFSTCRICGKNNGTADFTDGKYVWPEGLAHYVRDHGVRLPPRFVRHVTRRSR